MLAIVESAEVMGAVDEAAQRWSRFHEAWEMLVWVLSRDPTVGQPLTETGNIRAFVFDGSCAHDMPTIDLVYEITAIQVVLQRVRFRDAQTSAGTA